MSGCCFISAEKNMGARHLCYPHSLPLDLGTCNLRTVSSRATPAHSHSSRFLKLLQFLPLKTELVTTIYIVSGKKGIGVKC